MRRAQLLAVAAFLMFSASSAAAAPAGWMTSLTAAKKAAAASQKLILVDLYAEWCGWCKVLDRQVYSTAPFKQWASKFVLLQVDVDDEGEGAQLQRQFEAYSLPTTLVLTSDLALAGRLDGFSPTESYIRGVDSQLAAYAELETRYQRAKGSSDARLLQGLAEELYERADGRRAAALWTRLLELGKVTPESLGPFHYRMADAWRSAGEFIKAKASLESARREAKTDPRLIEACDLMSFRIAQEAGECKRAIEALEAFLKQHPKSEYLTFARQNLRALQAQTSCT